MCPLTPSMAPPTPDAPPVHTSIKHDDRTMTKTNADTPDQVHKNISSVIQFTDTEQLARLERQSHDLSDIIQLLEHGVLPSNNNRARKLTADIDNWILVEGILFHIYNPSKRNVNTVKLTIQQLAVP